MIGKRAWHCEDFEESWCGVNDDDRFGRTLYVLLVRGSANATAEHTANARSADARSDRAADAHLCGYRRRRRIR